MKNVQQFYPIYFHFDLSNIKMNLSMTQAMFVHISCQLLQILLCNNSTKHLTRVERVQEMMIYVFNIFTNLMRLLLL